MTFDEHPPGSSCPVAYNTDHLASPDDDAGERVGPQSRGPDWSERNPEAADMEAQRHRMYRLQGLTSHGRRL